MASAPPPPDVVVLTGGEDVTPAVASRLPDRATVIAADSGLRHADVLDLHVDLCVGDMDSVDSGALAAAEAAGTRVERHPPAKDATDLELALDAAVGLAPASVTVVGGHGGRLDHLVAGALLLAADRYAALSIVAFMGPATVTVVRDEAVLSGRPQETVSLIAVGGAADGVETEDLRFPLASESLLAGSTRGVSNEFVGTRAVVRLVRGVLLAVQPGEVQEATRASR